MKYGFVYGLIVLASFGVTHILESSGADKELASGVAIAFAAVVSFFAPGMIDED